MVSDGFGDYGGAVGEGWVLNRARFIRFDLLVLMTALDANGVKLVMVEKLDRLARDLMIQKIIIGDLRKNGFDLLSVAETDLLQNDPSRKLMRQIFGATPRRGVKWYEIAVDNIILSRQ